MTSIEHYKLEKDIPVFYVEATSYPEGIMRAHEKLHALVPPSDERRYFGLSRPEQGGAIVYKAAAEELKKNEAEQFGLNTLEIRHGNYISLIINDYAQHIEQMSAAFKKLLAQPGLDPHGYCVEWYLNGKDVRCMVRLHQ